MTPETQDAIWRLEAWAGCVRRLMAVAPTKAVMAETGVTGGHSTPPEREAIREAALRTVDAWLERDRAALSGSRPSPTSKGA